MSFLRIIGLLYCGCLFVVSLNASAIELLVAAPVRMDVAQSQFVDKFVHRLQKATSQRISIISPAAAASLAGDSVVLLTVGPEVLDEVLNGKGTLPVIAVYVPRQQFLEEVRALPNGAKRLVTLVDSDPDLKKQLALAEILFGARATCTLVTGLRDQSLLKDFKQFAKQIDLPLIIRTAEHDTSLQNLLSEESRQAVIIIDRSAALTTSLDLKTYLEQAYELNRQGVIAFSPRIVDAGALGTTYSSDDELAGLISDTLHKIGQGRNVPLIQHTEHFEVKLNHFLARSLNTRQLDDEQLKKEIELLLEVAEKKGASQ